MYHKNQTDIKTKNKIEYFLNKKISNVNNIFIKKNRGTLFITKKVKTIGSQLGESPQNC